MNAELRRLAVTVEMHEAEVWAACFDAAIAVPGNPLGATVDRSIAPPLVLAVAQVIDSTDINRVVGLGLFSPATREMVSTVVAFYRSHGQPTFRIELSPAAAPSELHSHWLTDVGLRRTEHGMTKTWHSIDLLPPASSDVEVRRLGRGHRDAVADLSLAAWGAWEGTGPLRTWFGATVGTQGFHHYGVFDGDQLVSVGALMITGSLAWLGFDATHPRYRSYDLRRSVLLVRVDDARRHGCRTVHGEIDSIYRSSPKAIFKRLLDRESYSSVPPGEGRSRPTIAGGVIRGVGIPPEVVPPDTNRRSSFAGQRLRLDGRKPAGSSAAMS